MATISVLNAVSQAVPIVEVLFWQRQNYSTLISFLQTNEYLAFGKQMGTVSVFKVENYPIQLLPGVTGRKIARCDVV